MNNSRVVLNYKPLQQTGGAGSDNTANIRSNPHGRHASERQSSAVVVRALVLTRTAQVSQVGIPPSCNFVLIWK